MQSTARFRSLLTSASARDGPKRPGPLERRRLLDELPAEVRQDERPGRRPLLVAEGRRRVEVLQVLPPVRLGLVDVPLGPLPEHRPEPVPARVDRQRLGGPGEVADQPAGLVVAEPADRLDQRGIEDPRQPLGQGRVDPLQGPSGAARGRGPPPPSGPRRPGPRASGAARGPARRTPSARPPPGPAPRPASRRGPPGPGGPSRSATVPGPGRAVPSWPATPRRPGDGTRRGRGRTASTRRRGSSGRRPSTPTAPPPRRPPPAPRGPSGPARPPRGPPPAPPRPAPGAGPPRRPPAGSAGRRPPGPPAFPARRGPGPPSRRPPAARPPARPAPGR